MQEENEKQQIESIKQEYYIGMKISEVVKVMYENMRPETIEDLVKTPLFNEIRENKSHEEIDHLHNTMCAEKDENADKQDVKVAVACTNAGGEGDFFFCKIKATDEDYNLGKHYDKAEEMAEAEGYERPFVTFDENEAAGRAVMNLFHWESASVIEIEQSYLLNAPR